jgi:hypothetical protein
MIYNIQCRNCKYIFYADNVSGTIECNCGAIQAKLEDEKRTVKTKNPINIVYLDNLGNEVIFETDNEKKTDLIRSLDEMLFSYESISSNAMMMPANQYDIQTILLILKSLLYI